MGPPRVSIILPVYNVEPFIGRCIESLQAQMIDGLEFIFVDDCGTDESMAAVEEWAAQDGRVRILRNERNIGAGASRNRGIEAARGDYLSFIDPDDYVSPDFYELLYAAAIADGGHDMAKGMRDKVDFATGDSTSSCPQLLNERIKEALQRGLPLYASFRYEHQSCIYRRALFVSGEVRYGTTMLAEDLLFLLRYCYQTNDIVILDQPVYFYVQRPNSLIQTVDKATMLTALESLAESISFFEQHGFDRMAQEYLLFRVESILKRMDSVCAKSNVAHEDYLEFTEKLASLICTVPGLEEATRGYLPGLPVPQRVAPWIRIRDRLPSIDNLRALVRRACNKMFG